MPLASWTILIGFLQAAVPPADPAQQVELAVGQVIQVAMASDAAEVHTPTLDQNYTNAPTKGNGYTFQVPSSGLYRLELRSHDFDSYLVLQAADGSLLAEDDDGLVFTHSRIEHSLEAGEQYTVFACALHGSHGVFELGLLSGPAPTLSQEEQIQFYAHEFEAKIAHLESDPSRGNGLALTLKDYGYWLTNLGQGERALPLLTRALNVAEELFGEDHPEVAGYLSYLAIAHQSLGNWQVAYDLSFRALNIYIKEYGASNESSGSAHMRCAQSAMRLGDYPKAEIHFRAAIPVYESMLSPGDPSLFGLNNSLALVLYHQGKLEQSKGQYLRLMAMAEEFELDESRGLSSILINFGGLLKGMGEIENAISQFERAYALRSQAYGVDNLNTIYAENFLASSLGDIGRHEEALPLAEHVYQTRFNQLGHLHFETIEALNNLATTHRNIGDWEQAMQLFERAVEDSRKSPNIDQNQALKSNLAINLGSLYLKLGRLQDARLMFQQVLADLEGDDGQDVMSASQAVQALQWLAGIYEAQFDWDTALEHSQRAYELALLRLGADHPDTARSMNLLANLYGQVGRHEEVVSLYLKAYEILSAKLGENHENSATLLGNIGNSYLKADNYSKALEYFRDALERILPQYGEFHPKVAGMYSSIGQAFFEQGDFAQAIEYFQRTLVTRELLLGSEHPETVLVMFRLGRAQWSAGQLEVAVNSMKASLKSALLYLDRELPSLSEAERFRFLQGTALPDDLLHMLYSLQPEDLSNAYHLFCNWKGKATRMQLASLKYAHSSEVSSVQEKTDEIRRLSQELSSLVLLPLARQQPNHADRVHELRASRIRLEQQLNTEIGASQVLQVPRLDEIQRAMPKGSVLLDFRVANDVFVWVTKSTGQPELLRLGSAAELRKMQSAFLQQSISRGGRNLQNKPEYGRDLVEALWQPLANQVADAELVLICPDGFLGELPFGILPVDQSFLIEKHRISYLSDASQLTASRSSSSSLSGPVIAVGGVNYFRRGELAANEEVTGGDRSRLGTNWSSLPATRVEVQALKDLHEYVLEWDSPMVTLEGKAATEEAVRALLPGQRYVHIATHGYFEPDNLPSLSVSAQSQQADFDEQIKAVGLLPGLLSGLVFAGVNSDADDQRDDGYLSAEEIQYLDLSACDLVVLSACETALGSARAGEGLMSMRRAFQVAGADSVVSSLWKVSDDATAELMKEFYTNLWQRELPRGEALHQAKLKLLHRNRADFDGEAQPSTWGAFVLSGAWQ